MIARPTIKAVAVSILPSNLERRKVLTVNVTLALIGLHHKQVGHMAGNMVLVTGRIAAQNLLQSISRLAFIPKRKQEQGRHTLWH